MAGNTFGEIFRFTTWGESHGPSIGCVVDGTPPLIEITEEEIQVYLDARKPGQNRFTTQRKEPDSVKKKILGQTYKYWSSVLPINPMNSLKKLDIPILSIIGERDEMTPIESVSFLGSEFERLGKENLTVKIVPETVALILVFASPLPAVPFLIIFKSFSAFINSCFAWLFRNSIAIKSWLEIIFLSYKSLFLL